jgi:aryl-alcohol dehydrogenase-like predicted oxidoreductase
MLPEASLPGGVKTSVLGYGCAALVGGRTRREARHLLDVALDSGIRHFDVARVYGTGDAEAVLGEFAARRRDSLTIASKFGIEPAGRGATVGAGKRLVRLATRRSRRLLALARRHSGRTVRRGRFSPEVARASLAVSLAQLGTERLDAYLLHDCSRADWAQPELQEALRELRAEGAIGCFGPATSRAEVGEILGSDGPRAEIAQLDADLASGPGQPLDRGDSATTFVTHGVYRRDFARLRALLSREELVAEWSARLDLDAGSAEVLGDLMLAAALRRAGGGIVLVSAGSPARIRRNAACAEGGRFDSAQLDEFASLAGAALRPTPSTPA